MNLVIIPKKSTREQMKEKKAEPGYSIKKKHEKRRKGGTEKYSKEFMEQKNGK